MVDSGLAAPWAVDEGRFGLKVWFRRRWCPCGSRPPYVVEDRYEWTWVYAAVRPDTGECFFLLLPAMDSRCFERFLFEWDAFLGDSAEKIGVVMDNAPSHGSGEVAWPGRFEPIPLPPYSPELNPAEQVFRVLRQALSNQIFASVADLMDALTAELRKWWEEPSLLVRLCGYAWWTNAVVSIDSS